MLRQAWGIGVESKRLFSKTTILIIGIKNVVVERKWRLSILIMTQSNEGHLEIFFVFFLLLDYT